MGKPTMDDVAKRAGVSRALVSLAMRGSDKVSGSSTEAIMKAADALGYRPNLIARNLASKRTMTIGLILNDLHNPFFPEIADGIYAAAQDHGYRLLINSGFLDDHAERQALEMFIDYQVDGVIMAGPRVRSSVISDAAKSIPIAVAGRPLRSRLVDTVNNNDHYGATLAIEHLIKLGHRRISHIDGGRGGGSPQRRAGYTATMNRRGLEPDVLPGRFTEASGASAAHHALSRRRRPTAIFAGNDLSAIGALDSIGGVGLDVPGDVSLVGYDNTWLAALRHIQLTTIDQHREAMGELAMLTLLDRIETGRNEPVHHVMTPSLVVRSTTSAPPRRAGG